MGTEEREASFQDTQRLYFLALGKGKTKPKQSQNKGKTKLNLCGFLLRDRHLAPGVFIDSTTYFCLKKR